MSASTKPVQKEHSEDVDLKHREEPLQDGEEIGINDVLQNKRLNRRLDLRVLPLCCWVYLLNFLDRGNIGNARVLNAETNDDMLQVTGLTPHGYALTVTLLLHYISYIADVVSQGSFTFFTPTIVTGLGYESIHAQLLTVPPWVVGFFVAITISYIADRFNARGWTITIFSLIGGAGWLTAGLLPADAYVQRYGCLCLAAAGAFPCAPSLTNWVTCNTPSFLTLPLAIAVNNSCAGIGQIIAQWIWKNNQRAQGFPTRKFVCAACSFLVAAIAAFLRIWYGRMNRLERSNSRGEQRVWAL